MSQINSFRNAILKRVNDGILDKEQAVELFIDVIDAFEKDEWDWAEAWDYLFPNNEKVKE